MTFYEAIKHACVLTYRTAARPEKLDWGIRGWTSAEDRETMNLRPPGGGGRRPFLQGFKPEKQEGFSSFVVC